ncbi:MAG: phasin family protein [Betaproteobacteria bacterium]
MATKAAAKKPAAKKAAAKKPAAKKRAAKITARKPAPRAPSFAGYSAAAMPGLAGMPGMADMAKMAKMMTPEQAIDLYKSNTKIALDIINAALEGTAKVRKLQFEGEEQARAMGRKAMRDASEAGTPNAMMAASQSVSQEAVESAMRYWGQMFELVVEVQKRLFTLMESQMAGVPGIKEAKAAMAMMPDMRQAQNVINALQGVVSSGGNAFESMQKVMGDFAKFMPGQRR